MARLQTPTQKVWMLLRNPTEQTAVWKKQG